MGVVLMQPGEMDLYHSNTFTSMELSFTDKNYMTTEREGLAMVYALPKFRHYLLGGHFKMFTNHSVLKYLVNNPMLGGKICRQLLLFQEFDFETIVKLSHLSASPNHLSWIETDEEPINIGEGLPDVQLFRVNMEDDYYAHIIQFLETWIAPEGFSTIQKKQFVVKASDFQLIVGRLYKLGPD